MISTVDHTQTAELTAQMLLEVGAVHFRPEEPFRFTSGLASPVYVDCRKLIAYPRIRKTLTEFAAATICRNVGFETLDSVAGGETAGIPFAAWIADRLGLPMQYVRKAPKGFGRGAQIEGDYKEGTNVLLVEDLATDGGSKLHFCKALREAGLNVKDTFVIFHYGIFSEAEAMLAENGLKMHALATWWDVLHYSRKKAVFTEIVLQEIENFLREPLEWSKEHGGISEI